MGITLLDYLEAVSGDDRVTRAELSAVMSAGSEAEKEAIWEKINAMGGYDALED